jgi:hypothetical protein
MNGHKYLIFMALPRGLPWPYDFNNLTARFASHVSRPFVLGSANLVSRGSACIL